MIRETAAEVHKSETNIITAVGSSSIAVSTEMSAMTAAITELRNAMVAPPAMPPPAARAPRAKASTETAAVKAAARVEAKAQAKAKAVKAKAEKALEKAMQIARNAGVDVP